MVNLELQDLLGNLKVTYTSLATVILGITPDTVDTDLGASIDAAEQDIKVPNRNMYASIVAADSFDFLASYARLQNVLSFDRSAYYQQGAAGCASCKDFYDHYGDALKAIDAQAGG